MTEQVKAQVGMKAQAGRLSRLAAALLLLAAPCIASAADAPDATLDLKGLSNVTLGVTQLTPDGAQCGLDINQIGRAAGHVIADAGIGLSDSSINRMTISAVTTRVGPDQCATAAMLGVYTKESFFSSTAGWVQSGYVVVWQRSLMVATPIGQHAAAVLGAAQRLSEQLLADWRAQNAPLPRTAAAPARPMGMTPRSAAASPPTQSAAASPPTQSAAASPPPQSATASPPPQSAAASPPPQSAAASPPTQQAAANQK